jgi:hypothetical protein
MQSTITKPNWVLICSCLFIFNSLVAESLPANLPTLENEILINSITVPAVVLDLKNENPPEEKVNCKLSFTSEVTNIVDVSCFGLSDGQGTEVATGGTAPYTCLWDNGETTVTAVMLDAGMHSVTVTDATGCTAIATGLIGQPDILELNIVSQTDAICNGESNGTATVAGSGGTAGYAYAWPGGLTGASQSTLQAGSYSVTVIDSHDCMETTTVVIGEPTPLSINIISTVDVSCNAGDDGQATIEGTGGTPPYSFLWPDGNTNAMRSDLSADNYPVTITDGNNCVSSTTVNIDEPFLLIANTSGSDESAPGAMDGSASANPFGGVGSYNYTWSTGSNSQSINNLSAGDYTVTVTDENDCISIETVVVELNCSLGISADDDDLECNGESNGELSVNISGQSDPVTIEWSNGGSTETISDLSAGSYSVTVTDANGCFDIIEAMVLEPDLIDIITDENLQPLCNGEDSGSISVSVSGGTEGYSYLWSNNETTEDITGLAAGNYQLTVTDANGCIAMISEELTEPEILEANTSGTNETDVDTGDGTATANPSGGTPPYTYNWSNGEQVQSIMNLVPDMYIVTVTDANNCSATQTVNVESDGCLLSVDTDIINAVCNGESTGGINLVLENEVGPVTFEWSTGETTQNISDKPAGNFMVTITDSENCVINLSLDISEPPAIDLQIEALNIPECIDGTDGFLEGVTTTKGVTYLWSNGSTDKQVSNLSPGNYCVTVTDINGCVDENCFDLVYSDTEPPIIEVLSDISIYLDEEGNVAPIQFEDFDNGSTDNCNVINLVETRDHLDCSNIGDNTITFVISDESGNASTGTFNAKLIDTFPPVPALKDIEVYTDENGLLPTINFNDVDNGTKDNCDSFTNDLGDLTYTCDDVGDQIITVIITDDSGNIASGEFTVSIRDTFSPQINCVDDFIVNVCDPVVYDIPEFSDNCGSPNLILVSGPESGTAFPAGENEILYMAIDASGNSSECSFTVTVEIDLAVEIETIDVSCFELSDGQFSYTVSGGNGPYSVTLDPEQQDSLNQSAGTYYIIVDDSQGCTILDSFEISQPDPLLLDEFVVTQESNSTGSDGSISITVIGGTPDYSYNWTKDGAFFSNDEDLTGLNAGEYVCSIIDANGCEFVTEVLTVEKESSIIDHKFDSSIALYPNPNNGNFFIEFENLPLHSVEIEIITMTGRKMISEQKFLLNRKIEMNELMSPGLYFVRIKSEDKIALKRIVIQ